MERGMIMKCDSIQDHFPLFFEQIVDVNHEILQLLFFQQLLANITHHQHA